jgi:hypothetical protein
MNLWRTGEIPDASRKILRRQKGKITSANPRTMRECDLLQWEWCYLDDLIVLVAENEALKQQVRFLAKKAVKNLSRCGDGCPDEIKGLTYWLDIAAAHGTPSVRVSEE